MEKLKALLRSRKFWAAVVALVSIFIEAFVPDFPLSEDQLLLLVITLASYIFGVAIDDGARSLVKG